MHLQGASGALPARPPHLADDLLPAEDHAGALGEQGEQVELLAGERDLGAVDATLRVGSSMVTGPDPQRRGGAVGPVSSPAGGAPAADRVDTGQQLTGVVRLDDIVVGAEVEAVDTGAHVGRAR